MLVRAVRKGRSHRASTDAAVWPALSDAQIRDVVAYIRTFASRQPAPACPCP
jgi:mono/diheme cytochrome c family protein